MNDIETRIQQIIFNGGRDEEERPIEFGDVVKKVQEPKFNVLNISERWTFWYWNGKNSTKPWIDLLMKVAYFENDCDFWKLQHILMKVDVLKPPIDYAVFRDEIKPVWEDRRNIRGGRWVISLPKHNNQCHQDLDIYWSELLFAMLGNDFGDETREVHGAVISVRRDCDRIALWTGDAQKTEAIEKIGQILKDRLGFEHTWSYQSHTSTRQTLQKQGKHPRLNVIKKVI